MGKNWKKRNKNKKDFIRTKDQNLYKEEGENDRLSELPDSLISYILSLLGDIKEVIRTTCLVSKRWEFLWTYMSEIDLDELSRDKHKIGRFVKYVGRLLDMCTLQRFSLAFRYDKRIARNLNSWVEVAVERNVNDISLKNYGELPCELPQMLYSHSSLTTLSIQHCIIINPGETFNWQSLKSLTISCMELSDCVMTKILSGCPVLEDLRLNSCSGFTCLNIFSKTFTKLEISSFSTTIDISVPYARELKISGWDITQLRLRDITSLVRASLDLSESTRPVEMIELLQRVQYVKELELGQNCVETLSMFESEGLKIPTSTRRCLTLNLFNGFSISGLLWILKSSPYLETLTIKGDYPPPLDSPYWDDYNLDPFEDDNIPEGGVKDIVNDLVFNHLKTINIENINGELIALAKFLLKSANVLRKMTVTYSSCFFNTKKLPKALHSYPKASPEAIVAVNMIDELKSFR